MADNHDHDTSVEDLKRRRFPNWCNCGLRRRSASVIAVTPFVLSMQPSERAKTWRAHPCSSTSSKLEEGRLVKVEWRGKPVVILRRSPEMMQGLDEIKDNLADTKFIRERTTNLRSKQSAS